MYFYLKKKSWQGSIWPNIRVEIVKAKIKESKIGTKQQQQKFLTQIFRMGSPYKDFQHKGKEGQKYAYKSCFHCSDMQNLIWQG